MIRVRLTGEDMANAQAFADFLEQAAGDGVVTSYERKVAETVKTLNGRQYDTLENVITMILMRKDEP